MLAAKNAGMKYIVITTKHHEGFANWPSAVSDRDIAATKFGKPIVFINLILSVIYFGLYASVVPYNALNYAGILEQLFSLLGGTILITISILYFKAYRRIYK